MVKLIAATCWATFSAVTWLLVHLVNRRVPDPYMDEKFHVAQAQAYCRGDYGYWEPKLTTPPGLYVLSTLLSAPLRWYYADPAGLWACSTTMLRYTNWLLLVALYGVAVAILRERNPGHPQRRLFFEAASIASFPVLYFVSLLFYTDAGSTFFIVLGYYLGLKRWHRLAALSCFVSLTFRQTNAVWTLLVAVNALLQEVRRTPGLPDEVRRRITAVPALSLNVYYEGIDHLVAVGRDFLAHRDVWLPHLVPYAAVEACFIVFLVLNRGIVLGDRAHHVAGLHFPQIYYCAAFLAAIMAPLLFRLQSPLGFLIYTAKYLRSTRFIGLSVLLIVGTAYSIHRFTYEHPFILADNRHYSFYVWKDIYQSHPSVRYALVPGYFFAFWLLSRVIATQQTLLWCLIYLACTALTLIPSPLFEFRYFILPFYFFRLNMPLPKVHRTAYELVWYTVVNYATLYLFLQRPFEWFQEPGVLQRFMW
ncbi:glucosyltransferase [Tieghemiomyces parasiticus]|uniref:Dol-P-Glc:Glc(2)Man(9)GlcNAc(2)-PP-Dol alpha-1,2-glucosyltransferase n=1 Tax=Tieghemiomyces parasiticus TaxID=78921 RepID=A0A9W8A840_9FUNG|nr:glucosyltransferase [Tieghemiomyces parasiticus]